MHQRLATTPVTVEQPAFTFQASQTHVKVLSNSPALGMKDLMTAMKREPLLHNCIIEQCAFDGDSFTATLRIEK
jgi:hypothetical protein